MCISAVIIMSRMVDSSRTSGYVDEALRLESVVFDGLESLWPFRGTVRAESKLT